MITSANCKNCGSYLLNPSKRKGIFDRLAAPAFTPYRCNACKRRQYKLKNVPAGQVAYDSQVATSAPSLTAPAAPKHAARSWKPLVRVAMVLLSAELTLQLTAGIMWLTRQPPQSPSWNGERIVLWVGDSYSTAANSPAPQDAYVPELAKLMNRYRHRWRVVNAPLPGKSSRDAALALEEQLPKLRPSAVYVLVGWNDGWSRPTRLERQYSAPTTATFPWRYRTALLVESLFPSRNKAPAPEQSVIRLAEPTLPAPAEGPFASTAPVKGTLAAHLLQMADSAKRVQADIVFMSYPFPEPSAFPAIVRQAASQSGAGWIDVQAAFAQRKLTHPQELYRPNGQLTDRGYIFLADLVAADLSHRIQRH